MSDRLHRIRLAEYRQRRHTELLAHRLYSQSDPSQSTDLLQALIDAEGELLRLERERRAREQAESRGLVLKTVGQPDEMSEVMLGEQTTGIRVQAVLHMSHIPTGIVHLLNPDQTPLVSFCLEYTGPEYVRLRLTSFIEGYSARVVNTVELLSEQTIHVKQLPTFFPDRLEHITELTRGTLHILIEDLDRGVEQETTSPIWLLARTSAYNGVEDISDGSWVDLSPYYAAWVTPNRIEVMSLLRKAADRISDRAIVGYQVDDNGVDEQVKAIFDALKAEEITYVSSVLSFGATRGEYMQRIRLPRESLAMKSANCIDATVLMASVLEAASLNAGLVLVPGHAFVAWERQDGIGQWSFLETTMIGTHDFEAARLSGESQAAKWRARSEQTGEPYYFRLLPLPELRARWGITPME